MFIFSVIWDKFHAQPLSSDTPASMKFFILFLLAHWNIKGTTRK